MGDSPKYILQMNSEELPLCSSVERTTITENFPTFSPVCFSAVGKSLRWASDAPKSCNNHYSYWRGCAPGCRICGQIYVYGRADYSGVSGAAVGFRRPVWLLRPGKWIHVLRFPCWFWQSPVISP